MATRPGRTATTRCLLPLVALLLLAIVAPAAAQSPEATPVPDPFELVGRVRPSEWALLLGVAGTPAPGTPQAWSVLQTRGLLSDVDLIAGLREGGYVIYFRHAATDFSQSDTDRQDLTDCATQRNLSDAGRANARTIGEGIRALGIPIGDVLSSEYCRTRETAEIAFGRVSPTRDLTSRASTTDPAARAERIEALRRLLTTPPAPGTNTVLVGHMFNLADATGVAIAEGEAAIFLPAPDGSAATPAPA